MAVVEGSDDKGLEDSSAELLQILKDHDIAFDTLDVSADETLKNNIRKYLDWPKFPQLVCRGQLLGDLDIVKELADDGELKQELDYFLTRKDAAMLPVKKSAESSWVTAAESDSGDADELLDEAELLPDENLPTKSAAETSGCGVADKPSGKRKACKNCSCGLADELAKDGSANAQPKSACGSCYLGDAFRCETCPYRGMPPFKPGEKVEVASVDDL